MCLFIIFVSPFAHSLSSQMLPDNGRILINSWMSALFHKTEEKGNASVSEMEALVWHLQKNAPGFNVSVQVNEWVDDGCTSSPPPLLKAASVCEDVFVDVCALRSVDLSASQSSYRHSL